MSRFVLLKLEIRYTGDLRSVLGKTGDALGSTFVLSLATAMIFKMIQKPKKQKVHEKSTSYPQPGYHSDRHFEQLF
jgi:hypothetical protein